jgi:polyisoprenoid-binding protein YceI
MKKSLIFLASVMLCSFSFMVLKDWEIQQGCVIRFDGKYAHGTFDKLQGSLRFDPENPASARFDVTIDVNSIETGIALKNKHAKSEKWFDAEKFPLIRFVSSEVVRLDTSFLVRGDLEIHGITRPVAIPFSFRQHDGNSLFYGQFNVNRADFGIGKATGKASDSTHVEVLVPVRNL